METTHGIEPDDNYDGNDDDGDGIGAAEFGITSSSSGSSNSDGGERESNSGGSGSDSGERASNSEPSSNGDSATQQTSGRVTSGFDESFLRGLQSTSDNRSTTGTGTGSSYTGGRTETVGRTGTEEGAGLLGDVLSGQIPLNVKLGDLDEVEGIKELKLPKIRLVIASCLYYGLGVFKSAPIQSFWRKLVLNEKEALVLGDVWTNWIESTPSRKKSAITQTISKVAPSFTALAVTARIFLPRIFEGRIQNLVIPRNEQPGPSIEEQQRQLLLIQRQIQMKREAVAQESTRIPMDPGRAAIIDANDGVEI